MTRELNVLGIETPRGYRVLRLMHGNIADAEADLRIVSSHAQAEFRPSGAALSALGFEEGLRPDQLEPHLLLRPGELFGTWRLTPPTTPPVLVLRMPGAEVVGGTVDEQLRHYERCVWAVYASLAALELEDEKYERVAFTLFGGRRGYPIGAAMRIVLRHACRWLERSRYTRQIDLVEYDVAHLHTWSGAMDEILGRKAHDVASDSVVAALADELLARFQDGPFESTELLDKVVVPLREALHPEQRRHLRVARLSVPGRILAESVVTQLEVKRGLKKKDAGDLHGRIERLLDAAAVEPWITAHLHALRIYGNEEVHFKGKDRRFEPRDLPGILASLLRIVLFLHER